MAKIISKVELTNLLKDLGLKTVSMSHPGAWNGKAIKDYQGKTHKGISGGSTGPMTMTDAHSRHDREVENKVYDALRPCMVRKEDNGSVAIYHVQTGEKTFRKITFLWREFQTYSAAYDYDSSYVTNWYVCSMEDYK